MNFYLKSVPIEKFRPLKDWPWKELVAWVEMLEVTLWYDCGLYLKMLVLEVAYSALETSGCSRLRGGEMISFLRVVSSLVSILVVKCSGMIIFVEAPLPLFPVDPVLPPVLYLALGT